MFLVFCSPVCLVADIFVHLPFVFSFQPKWLLDLGILTSQSLQLSTTKISQKKYYGSWCGLPINPQPPSIFGVCHVFSPTPASELSFLLDQAGINCRYTRNLDSKPESLLVMTMVLQMAGLFSRHFLRRWCYYLLIIFQCY